MHCRDVGVTMTVTAFLSKVGMIALRRFTLGPFKRWRIKHEKEITDGVIVGKHDVGRVQYDDTVRDRNTENT